MVPDNPVVLVQSAPWSINAFITPLTGPHTEDNVDTVHGKKSTQKYQRMNP